MYLKEGEGKKERVDKGGKEGDERSDKGGKNIDEEREKKRLNKKQRGVDISSKREEYRRDKKTIKNKKNKELKYLVRE